MVPFAKTGGLADVVGALVREFAQLGHEIRACMPLYAAVRRANPGTQPVLGLQNVGVTIDGRTYAFSVRTTRVDTLAKSSGLYGQATQKASSISAAFSSMSKPVSATFTSFR